MESTAGRHLVIDLLGVRMLENLDVDKEDVLTAKSGFLNEFRAVACRLRACDANRVHGFRVINGGDTKLMSDDTAGSYQGEGFSGDEDEAKSSAKVRIRDTIHLRCVGVVSSGCWKLLRLVAESLNYFGLKHGDCHKNAFPGIL